MILKCTFGYILVTMMTYTEIVSWTIDLPEVRQYLFDKSEQEKNDYNYYVSTEKTFYDNINPNSVHHSNVEKEVLSVVHDGSAYLEGLRRAVERYIEYLENCTSTNNTRINVAINSTWLPQNELTDTRNITLPTNSSSHNLASVNQSTQSVGESQNGNNSNVGDGTSELCRNVSRNSEYVRRVAQLAVWTTKRLQDLVYAGEYQNYDGREEDELIFKLAWFLDRLAKMTGYIPDPKMFMGEEPRETTTSIPYPAPPMPDFSVPDDVKRYMMSCIKVESPIPATVRCAFPLPLPPGIPELFNLTDTASTPQPSTVNERVVPLDSVPGQSSLELLTAAESISPLLKTPVPSKNVQKRDANMRNVKAFLPRELSDLTHVKIVKKRSIGENPIINLMKYYVKHSAWVNSNPKNNLQTKLSSGNDETFDVSNHLTDVKSVQKRSLVHNKNNQVRLPAIPMPDLSRYVKNKPGIRYLREHVILAKIKNILERMHKHKVLNNKNKLPTPLVPFRTIRKRSLKYERMYLPRVSENPMQDISYYMKNKEGTEYNPSLLQAAQARAALENHFQTGNILTVRQYGSNYNPLIPLPFYAGVLRSMADS